MTFDNITILKYLVGTSNPVYQPLAESLMTQTSPPY